MSLYQTVKSAITVRQVGEMYGMGPDRHGMVCCPFHSDNHPSMMLNESYYYCFACWANGDAIDLTAKLFDLNRSEEHTSELQSPCNLVCRLLLEKKNFFNDTATTEIYTLSLHDALPISSSHFLRFSSSVSILRAVIWCFKS